MRKINGFDKRVCVHLRKLVTKTGYRFFGTRDKWPFWLLTRETLLLARIKGMDVSNILRHPKTFTEKITWLMFFYRHPDMSGIVDKVTFKSYVEKKLGPGHTIPLLGVFDSLDALEQAWDSLPDYMAVKSNCSGGDMNRIIVRGKSQTPFALVREAMSGALDPKMTLVNSQRWAYHGLKPKIMVEEYRTNTGNKLIDYKFFCFHGEPRYIYVDNGESITHYDMDWNRLDVKYMKYKVGECARPAHFSRMVDLARVLSADFPFVRVDFYDTDNQVYVGEMTFYPGWVDSFYTPESFNLVLGSCLDISRIPKENLLSCWWTRHLR